MKKLLFLLVFLTLASIVGCKGQTTENQDYVCQDGFYFSRESGEPTPIDTALHQGTLTDGTRFFFYKNEREDYASYSCIVQRRICEAEQALIVVGDIEYQKAIGRLDEIIKQTDGLKKIPLYTEANYYRFGGAWTEYKGRIDLRIPIIPAVHPELRPTSFSLQHFANFCLLSQYVDYKLTMLKGNGELPASIEDVYVYPNLLLDGADRECLCFHIDAKPGMEEQAKNDVRHCLQLFTRTECTELQLNLLRENFRQMVRLYYMPSQFNQDQNTRLGNHAIIKRIADAYVLGNELYDYAAEGEKLIIGSACCYTEFINAMYEATIMHNPNY